MANLNNSDLLVVGRGAATYKATFKELSDSLPDPSLPDATEAVKGVAEVATQAETNAGADDTRMVTPLKLKEYVTEQLKATWLPAPFNMGSVGGSTWNGPADTVTATGDVEVKIGNGAWGTGGPVTTSTQLQARFKPASIDAAPHGSTLTGSIQNAAGSVSQQYTGTIDKLPGAITITPAADVTASAVSESAASTAVSGINAPARIWLDSTDGTNAEVSIGGGAWTAVPTTAAAGLAITNGETFRLRHTTQAGASTVTTTTVNVGWVAASSVQVSYATTNAATKAPDVGVVTLSDVAGGDRFTSTAFPVSATMTEDGLPVSTKKLKAYVEGSLKSVPQTSAITKVEASTDVVVPAYYELRGMTTNSGYGGPPVSFTAATLLQVNVAFGATPNASPPNSSFYFKLDVPAVPVFNRTAGTLSGYTNTIWRSNDGVNWTEDGTFHALFGPPDETCSGTAAAKYWAWLVASGNMGAERYAITKASSTVKQPVVILTLTDTTGLAEFAAGDAVTEVGGGNDAGGIVDKIDQISKTIQLSSPTGTWDVGSSVKGPLKAPPGGATTKLYCKLDAAGAVADLQSADPGFTAWTPVGAGPYTGTVSFPATLPTGNPPDTDMPAGTTLTVEVEASNTAGTDSATSNTITP